MLFTQTVKQWEVTEVLKQTLPEGMGTVFYPCVELWMGALGKTVIRPLFPGYVFIRSVLPLTELHQLIRDRRRDVLSFIRELRLSEERIAEGQPEPDWEAGLVDLPPEEAEFLDFMLQFRYDDGAADGSEDARAKRMSDAGVLRMSRGYREGNRFTVMEGPLRGFEAHIRDVRPRDRLAYLDFSLGGKHARAGLELLGKRYWFPDDPNAPDILTDGTEVRLKDIAKHMMR